MISGPLPPKPSSAKAEGSTPDERQELIAEVLDSLSPEDIPVTNLKERCLILGSLT